MTSTKTRGVAELVDLVGVMRRAEGFADVREALLRGASAAIDGAWGSSCALAAAALAGDAGKDRGAMPGRVAMPAGRIPEPVLLVVLPRISEVDDFAVDLAGFLGAIRRSFRPGNRCPANSGRRTPC